MNLFDTIEVSGGFSYKQSNQVLVLSDNDSLNENRSVVEAEMSTFGLYHASAFVGVRGLDDSSNDDDTGILFENVDLALAMFDEKEGDRKWMSLQSNIGLAQIAGISDVDLLVADTSIVINKASDDGMVIDYSYQAESEEVINYKGSDFEATELSFTVGSDDQGVRQSVTFDMNDDLGDYLQVSGYAYLNLFGLVSFDGAFAVEIQSKDVVVSSNSITSEDRELVETDLLSFGMYGVNAFVGVEGANLGISLSDVNLSLSFFSDKSSDRKWISALADIGGVALEGIEGVELFVSDTKLQFNKESSDGKVIDYSFTDDEDLLLISQEQDVIDQQNPDLTDLVLLSTELVNSNYIRVYQDNAGNQYKMIDAVLDFSKLTFIDTVITEAVEASEEVDASPEIKITRFKALDGNIYIFHYDQEDQAYYTAFDGESYNVTIKSKKVSLDGDFSVSSGHARLIEFHKAFRATQMSALVGVDLDGNQVFIDYNMDDSNGDFLKINGYASLNLFNTIEINGGFGIEQSTKVVVLSNNQIQDEEREVVSTDFLSIGLYQANAFAGIRGDNNESTDDDLGIIIEDLDLAIALYSEEGGDRSWTTIQANVGLATLNVIDGISGGLSDTNLLLNTSSEDDMVIDYQFDQDLESITSLEKSNSGLLVKSAGEMALINSQYEHHKIKKKHVYKDKDGNSYKVESFYDAQQDKIIKGFQVDDVIYIVEKIVTYSYEASLFSYKKKSHVQWNITGLIENLEIETIDFTATSIDVSVGSDTSGEDHSIRLNIDDSKGDLFNLSGRIHLNLFDAVSLDGGFAFSTASEVIVVSDNSGSGETREVVTAEVATFGIVDANAFVGIRGADDTKTSDDTGFIVEDLNLALALFSSEGRTWTTVQADIGLAAFTGIEGIDVSVSDAGLLMNKAADDGTIIDYQFTSSDEVQTLSLVSEADRILKTATELEFINNQFDHKYSKKKKEHSFKDQEGVSHLVTLTSQSKKGDIGGTFEIEDGTIYEVKRFVTYKTHHTFGFTYKTKHVNWKIIGAVDPQAELASVEYRATDFSMIVGVDSEGEERNITFDLDDSLGDFLQVSGHLTLNLFDSLEISGGFAFETSTKTIVTSYNLESDTRAVQVVDMVSFGIYHGSVFIGSQQGNDTGFVLSDVDLALVHFQDKETPEWKNTTVQANIGQMSIVGVDDINLSINNAQLQLNTKDTLDYVVDYVKTSDESNLIWNEIEYEATDLEVALGVDSDGLLHTLKFDIDDNNGEFFQVTGEADIDIAGFVSIHGGFALEKIDSKSIRLTNNQVQDSEDVEASVFTFGMYDVNAFAGSRGASDSASDDVGIELTNVNLALALYDESAGDRQWTSLYASVGSASILGVKDVEISATDTTLSLNQAANDGSVIDYVISEGESSATDLVIVAGTNVDGDIEKVRFTFDGNEGQTARISGNLSMKLGGFASLEGGYALVSKEHQDVIVDGENIDTSLVSIALSDVSVFAGSPGKTDSLDDNIGLYFNEVDLALALFSENEGQQRTWSAIQASGDAQFLGLDHFDISLLSSSLLLNNSASDGSVIDFAKMLEDDQAFSVIVGTDFFGRDERVLFDIDGDRGQFLQVGGNLTFALSDFLYVSGGFAFGQSDFDVILASGDVVATDLLS
ncbi:hypothetical protein MJH12_14080, partial [bacterium]|nr:hypothetical protein [bacterium]